MRRGGSNFFRRLADDRTAATAAEFTLVLPLLLLFIFGIIDVGRLMWEWNRAEKATQMGVRYAVVTDMVSTELADYDFMNEPGVIQGAPVSASIFPGIRCTMEGTTAKCDCLPAKTCVFLKDPKLNSEGAFNNIVERMRVIDPTITAENVVIEYEPSGLGFAGNRDGPDVAPIVTVSIRDMVFESAIGQLFGGTLNKSGFASSLTMEDAEGDRSN